MTCPYCEIHKLSAAMWRNKAYELGGTPLPWDADKKIAAGVTAERKRLADILKHQASVMSDHFEVRWLMELATALRRSAK
jgi:hypothetical protein